MEPQLAMELAESAAVAGGEILASMFGSKRVIVESKTSATDMVSDADRASETIVVETIVKARPDDSLLGEEGTSVQGTTGVRWIVDPLDGTTNFLYGIPQFCVSVGVEDDSGPLAGCVFDPIGQEVFTAARGLGARLNGNSILVSSKKSLNTALVATGFSYLSQEREAAARALVPILPAVRDVRRAGSAALDLSWVACGRLDGYFEAPVFAWDGAAGRILVTEAGGKVSPMPAIGPSGAGLVASGPEIHADLLELVGAKRGNE